MTETLVKTLLEHIECPRCGLVFGISKRRIEVLMETKNTFYCPSGHEMSYGENDMDRLKKKLNQEKQRTEYLRADVERERNLKNSARHTARTHKGHVTRIKNRVSKGVCPCCNRHFKNLERHMKGQHPSYTEAEK